LGTRLVTIQAVAKRWSAVYDGHEILVVNTWFSCKLYIDRECRDTNQEAVAWNAERPRLSASLPGEGGKSHTVVVYAKSRWGVRIKICVDGHQVGGDVF
jgi:hypothetical protein